MQSSAPIAAHPRLVLVHSTSRTPGENRLLTRVVESRPCAQVAPPRAARAPLRLVAGARESRWGGRTPNVAPLAAFAKCSLVRDPVLLVTLVLALWLVDTGFATSLGAAKNQRAVTTALSREGAPQQVEALGADFEVVVAAKPAR